MSANPYVKFKILSVKSLFKDCNAFAKVLQNHQNNLFI